MVVVAAVVVAAVAMVTAVTTAAASAGSSSTLGCRSGSSSNETDETKSLAVRLPPFLFLRISGITIASTSATAHAARDCPLLSSRRPPEHD